MPNARLCFLIPLAVAVVGFGIVGTLGFTGWPGEVGSNATGFCEASLAGVIKQPVNTWSNAGFVLFGLWAGWQSYRDVAAKKSAAWANRLVTTYHFPAALASCSVLIGIGSTALHASTTAWGAEFDHLAMHIWGGWCIAYALVRLFRANDREFYSVWLMLIGGVVTRIVIGQPYAIYGSTLFALMITIAVLIEALGRWRNRSLIRMDTHYLAWSIAIFAVADGCRRIGSENSVYCDPHSIWQGHAAWHLLSAGATAFLYLYVRSERTLAVMDDSV